MPEPRLHHRTKLLLDRFKGGDALALDELFASSIEPLLVYVRARLEPGLRSRLDPGDVVQETLAKGLHAIASFDPAGPGAFVGWLCRIADRQLQTAREHHGAAKRSPQVEQRVSRIVDLAGSSKAGPQTIALRRDENERLARALDALAEEERAALLLRHFQGMTLEQIATRLDRSTGATHRLLGRAIHRLGTVLRGSEDPR